MAPGPTVTMSKQKWGGRPHIVTVAEWLGVDDFGTWLYLPIQDTITRRAVSCVPSDRWWVASWLFDEEGQEHKVYVDIGTPPVWTTPAEVVFVDLELDVERVAGKTTHLDIEEFHSRARTVPYPLDVVQSASRTAEFLVASVRDRLEPFDEVGPRWFARATAERTAK